MKVFKKIQDITAFLDTKRAKNLSIGMVPTMGALHDGHLCLLSESRKKCDVVVVSIFVNPTQFNDPKDLEKYPRTIEKDMKALISAGCDVLFCPEVEEMYPPDAVEKHFQLGELEHILEGEFRPGHFQGVCQIVEKLFLIVKPDRVFFGQKDYQQCMVIKKLLQLTPDFSKIEMHIVPIKREQSGLVMSSRNVRLSEQEKKQALGLYESLKMIAQEIKNFSINKLVEMATTNLEQKGCKVEYIAIADAEDLSLVTPNNSNKTLVVLIAAYVGGVRLIDNLVIH